MRDIGTTWGRLLCGPVLAGLWACGGEETIASVPKPDAGGQVAVDGGLVNGSDAASPADGTTPADGAGTEDTGTAPDTAQDAGAGSDATESDAAQADATVPDAAPDDAGNTDTIVTPPQCTGDADCAKLTTACSTGICTGGTCTAQVKADGAPCDDGNGCSTDDTCAAGSCAGKAKACDDGNPCTTDGCKDGSCVALPAAATCEDGNACTAGDACKDGQCQPGAAANCDDKNTCTTDACDPKVGCQSTPATGPCDDGDKCTGSDACKDGACTGTPSFDCDDGNPCTTDGCDKATGNCLFGAAPAGSTCDDGNACTQQETCASGLCKGGTVVDCNDNNPCTDDSCDKAKGCLHANNAASCDDGNACTQKDGCALGLCGGVTLTCDDGNPCTDDGCDPKTGCTKTNNTAPCSVGDVCQAAQCQAGACKALGGPKNCDDGNPCTADGCDAKTGCTYKNAIDGSQCSEGDKCVGVSTCSAGNCVAGAKVNCDDGNACTADTCDPKAGCAWPLAASCDDGNACTVGDACGVVVGKGATCLPGAKALACNDNNACTTDSCDPKTGCVFSNTTAACDDGNPCTGGDVCGGGKCAGQANTCADGNPCTADNCDPKSGACSWVAAAGPCDDGSACTTNDACAGGKCSGAAKVCSDNDVCTTDSCDAKTGGCVFAPGNEGGACDDGSVCTKDDACKAGKCVGASAVNCDDGLVCTDDACDAKAGTCSHVNNKVACDDGNKCTLGDACVGGSCKAGALLDCNDKSDCTADSCDANTGKCLNVAAVDGTPCDDGLACTNASACKGGLCTPGGACSFASEAFTNCGAPNGWTFTSPPSTVNGVQRNVKWAVDQTPNVGSQQEQQAHGCSLNFNDGQDHCDPTNQGCMLPVGIASSPEYDWTAYSATTGRAVLSFDSWISLAQQGQGPENDAAWVWVKDTVTGKYLMTSHLYKAGNQNAWRSIKVDLAAALGHKFVIEFSLFITTTQNTNNLQGTGWFVDNVGLQLSFEGEVCFDFIDNDGNGKIDCADPACASAASCTGKQLLSDDFACGAKQWNYTSSSQSVVWAVDQTPALPAMPYGGQCSLNYNDDTDYNNNQTVQGEATWGATIDATGTTQLAGAFQLFFDTEPLPNFDQLHVQLSTDNFNNCNQGSVCTTQNSRTITVPKTQLDWTVQAGTPNQYVMGHWALVTLTGDNMNFFANKKFQLRLRFSSIDNQYNGYQGPFVQKFRLWGK